MIDRQCSNSNVVSPSRLLCYDGDRQVFENEQGALLELSSTSLEQETGMQQIVDGGPLPAYLLDDDGDCCDDVNNDMPAARAHHHTGHCIEGCFRVNVN